MTGVIPIKIFSNQLECDKCDVVDERSVQNVHECVDNKQLTIITDLTLAVFFFIGYITTTHRKLRNVLL